MDMMHHVSGSTFSNQKWTTEEVEERKKEDGITARLRHKVTRRKLINKNTIEVTQSTGLSCQSFPG